MALTTVTNRTGPHSTILAEHHNELVNTLTGLQNELLRMYSSDAANYGVIIKNTGTGSKGLLVQDAAGATLLDVSSAGTILGFANGTAGAPSIRASADTDTGFWFPAANSWGASIGGVNRFRQYDTGSVAVHGGLFVRTDGLVDQSAQALMTLANTTHTGVNYLLASYALEQTSSAGDNGVLRLVHSQKSGGGASPATLRGIEVEVLREPGTTHLTSSAGNLGIELGVHLAARSEATLASATAEPGYVAESPATNPNLFLLSQGADWFPAWPGVKMFRSGTGLWMSGIDGFDYFLYLRDEQNNDVLVHDQYGRLRLRPAGFQGATGLVFYYNGAYTNYTVAASASDVAGSSTALTPQNTTEFWYVGSGQTFGRLHVAMRNFQAYGAGTPVLKIEVWNGSAWAQVTPRAALTFGAGDVGTVVSDGTDAFRQSGTIAFAPPLNWTKNTVNGQERYWARFSITGIVATVQGQAESIIPGTGEVLAVYPTPADANPALTVHHTGSVLVGPGTALATNGRGGYLAIPVVTGGAPSAAPVGIGTRAALVFRTDTNQLYAYNPITPAWVAI